MLSKPKTIRHSAALRQQRGVVLLITLIVLVAMTLASIAMVRSVDTTNMIAGNLSFHQAATHSADSGIETAISWLENHNSGGTLQNDSDADGYKASFQDPDPTETWDYFWNNSICSATCNIATLTPDSVGNTVQYWIQRMCKYPGPASSTTSVCSQSVTASSSSSSMDAGTVQLNYSSQVYYRITAKVSGPRNTVSYVQAIVAL